MRYLRLTFLCLVCCVANAALRAQTNVLRVAPVTFAAGKTASLPIELDNASDIVAVQFDIDVPYDLAAAPTATDRTDPWVLSATRAANHQVTMRQTSNGHWVDANTHGGISYYKTYRFMVYSDTNERLQGSTGTLITLEMPLPDDLANGTVFPITLIAQKVVLSDRDLQNVVTAQQDGTLTIETVPRPDLVPTAVSVTQTLADPGDQLAFQWTVENQGDLATGAGWTERIYLESQTTGNRVHIGTQAYEGTLAVGGSIQRTATFQLDELPGISGMVRPVVQIVPAAGCGEISLNQDNNTLAAKNYTLRVTKQLLLTVTKSLIPKNSTGGYWCELQRSGDNSIAEVFNISSNDKAGQRDRLSFSNNGTVTFTKGANRTGFYVYAVNNNRFDVSQEVAVIVNEPLNNGYDMVSDTVRVEETNQVPITMTTDKTDYNEGDIVHLTVSVPVRPWPGQLAVYLGIEEQKRFKLPQRVVFEEGALTATIDIPVLQDKNPANDVSVKITGTADHHQKGETLIMLHDDDVPAIQMTLTPKTVSEGAGPQAIMGTITRSEVTNNKITIKLTDDGVNDIYYSTQTITMPAGTTTVNFPLGVRDNQTVDGDRLVHIRAAIYMTDCNCSAIGDKQAVVTDSITITDDDGPTLTLTTDRATILEGDDDGSTLTISRNTEDNSSAVTVTLTTDAQDVQFQQTVTIPAGQQSVTTKFVALSNSTEEGDRTISIVASATGFSSGSTWLLISDRTLPDATFAGFSLAEGNINMGDGVAVSMQLQNIGAAALPAGTIVRLYREGAGYSNTTWTDYTLPEAVEKGQVKTFTFTPTAVDRSGVLNVWATIDPNNRVSELLKVNNTSDKVALTVTSLFNYTAATDKAVYNEGDMVNFTGTATGVNGSNTMVSAEFFVEYNGVRTIFNATSDEEGNLTGIYQVPAGYKGTVSYGACNRNEGEGSANVLGQFEVYGFERVTTNYVTNEIYKGEPKTGTIRLRNLTPYALNNITATFTGATGNYDIGVTPLATLPANGEADLTYTITGHNVTTTDTWEQIQFILTSEEGAKLSVNTWNYTKQHYADLAVSENYIKTNIVRGKVSTYPLVITNKGEAETGKVTVSLPSGIGKLITLASPAELPSMQTGDSATVMLRFNGEGLDLNVEQCGTFTIECENGPGVGVRFALTPVSSSLGSLSVYVQDEFTIYGDKDGNHPYVSGATVTLKDYNTGADVASQVTGERGAAQFSGINEGYYQLYVTAPKHDSYRQNVLVSPGDTKQLTATISYQAVAVSWDVVETEVDDEYEIVTTLTYETQVPVPVIVMTMPDSLNVDRIDYGKATMFNIVLRNEGLITAQSTTLTLPEISGYTLTPLVEYEGVNIGAQQSYVIPVRITRDEEPAAVRGVFRASGGVDCSATFNAGYYWPCGAEHKHAWVGHLVSLLADHDCGAHASGFGGYGGGTGGPGLMGGQGWRPNWNEYQVNRGIIEAICAGLYLVPTPPAWITNAKKANNIRKYIQSNDDLPTKIKNIINEIKPPSAIDKIKGVVNKPLAPIKDVYNFFKGTINAYNKYGPGAKSRALRAPEDEQQTEEDLAVYEEGSAEWYEQQFGQYYENGNDHLYQYLNKMSLYGTFVTTLIEMQQEVWGAKEAVLEMTDEFMATVDDYDKYINELGGVGPDGRDYDFFYDVAFHRERSGMGTQYLVSLYDWWYRLDNARLNGSPDFYDFNYQNYLQRWFRTYHYDQDRITYDNLKNENIIHMYLINMYSNRLDSCENNLVLQGFDSWDDLFMSAEQDILDFYSDQGSSTCATVKLEIDQTLVMTRQAFRGTLTIENSLDSDLKDIELSLLVKNLLNEEATSHEFQINFETIDGFEGGVEGPWTLGPKAKGTATILFIPTKYAAPDDVTTWSFGGTLYFTDGDGVTQVRELSPVALQVKPSPELDLTYFVQRDIYGDNPLTKDVIEPVIPADFSVLIHNKGKGDATNIRMFTRQPKIIENEKGLLIDFNIISSRLNGGETVLALDSTIATPFGDIPAGGSSYAEWGLTSSLLGHFVKYDISVNHVSSYGNPDLSLLDQVTIHELIHAGATTNSEGKRLRAWAVNDQLGINPIDQPDRLYLSDGTTKPILSAVENTTMKWLEGFKYQIRIDRSAAVNANMQTYNDANGDVWFYTSFADPTMGGGGVVSVVPTRGYGSGQLYVDSDNCWQTQYVMRDGADPLRDNKVHLLLPYHKMTGFDGEYIIEFEPTPQNRLDVKSIETVPGGNDIATAVLDELTVAFNKPIKPETFTRTDMVLRYEGEKQASDITITKAEDSDSIFTLKMSDVSRNGYYTLQVLTNDIKDQEGFAGQNGKQVGWMLYKDGLVQYNVEPWPNSLVGNVETSSDQTNGDAAYGSNVTMTANPSEGYDFSYWGTVDESVETAAAARARVKAHAPEAPIAENQISRYSNENPVVVPMNKSYNLRAVFKTKSYIVSIVSDNRQGTVNIPSALYDHGTVLNLHATPAEGYDVVGFSDGEQVFSTDADCEYTVTKPVTITVLFKSNGPETIVLKESEDYTPVDVETADVRLQRSFRKGGWNTVCLPCPVDDPQAVFGSGTRVAQLTGITDKALQFESVATMAANVPYLLYVGSLNNNTLVAEGTDYQSIYDIGITDLSTDLSTLTATKGAATISGTYTNQMLTPNSGYYTVSGQRAALVETATASGCFTAFLKLTDRSDRSVKIAVDGEIIGELLGDVNNDGMVGIGDIVSVTNIMAGTENDPATKERADLNGDGDIGIGDIVSITNIMAGLKALGREARHLLENPD